MKERLPFDNKMSRLQTIAGWSYLPLHFLVLPILLSLYAVYSPDKLSEAAINVIYYLIGISFVLLVMWTYLRQHFDVLIERVGFCVITLLMAILIDYALSYVVTLVLTLIESGELSNPNNEAVMELADMDYGAIRGIAIFLAPIVEEVLFRGVVFGSLRAHSRVLAYASSILLFSVYHVWQYVAVYGDFSLYIYAIQYIPVSFALAWAYERSNTIWTPIFFHMLFNALSFYVLNM